MNERFKLILEQLKLTPSEFADRIGVQRSSISHVMSGRNKPGIDFLEKILIAFPEIDATWLITGKARQEPHRIENNVMPGIDEFKPNNTTEDSIINKKPPLPAEEKAVDHIIIVYKDNTFRILNHPER